MTRTQIIRAQRRELRRRQERRERVEAVLFALALMVLLAVYGIAGAMDYSDRTEGLGASMLPSDSWFERDTVLTTKEVG